ncbi:MAG: hypothetical protein JW939_08340 [Candidatus Thermoplasmatota archaeon]|nr:hypothetical protein [Candidatus Thermoplasmatota archaeon]
MSGKIEEIGSRLGLTDIDVKILKRERRKWAFFIGIGSIILAILAFIIGLILGLALRDSPSGGSSYPFAISGFTLTGSTRFGLRKVHIPLLALLGFLSGISQPVFGGDSIDYGVFSPTRRNVTYGKT